jgi:hypothetical protein
MNPFDYVNSINQTKKNLMRGTENDQLAEKGYNPFLTNRALSYHHDTVALANEMNQRSSIDFLLQYEFLLNSVRSKKRFSKWEKKEDHGDINAIKEYYNCSDSKALQAYNVLTSDQLILIRKKLEKGRNNASHISRSATET